MSHLTHIRTTIKNQQVLEKVLIEMIDNGLNGILQGAKLEHNTDIYDPFGNSKIAELVIRRVQNYQGGYDFGFKLNDFGEFEFLTRDGSKHDAQKFMETLTPWYAKENAIAALIAQGFEIEQQTESNGEIIVTASKWA